jgi:hypothetical protein
MTSVRTLRRCGDTIESRLRGMVSARVLYFLHVIVHPLAPIPKSCFEFVKYAGMINSGLGRHEPPGELRKKANESLLAHYVNTFGERVQVVSNDTVGEYSGVPVCHNYFLISGSPTDGEANASATQ